MAEHGTPERGAATPLGRGGRPVRRRAWAAVGCVGAAAVIGFAVTRDDQPIGMRPMPDNAAEIAPSALINTSMPVPVQTEQQRPPAPLLPPMGTPIMPAQTNPLSVPQQPQEKPRRVTSFSAKAKEGMDPQAQAALRTAPQQPQMPTPGQQDTPTQVAFAGKTMPGLMAGQPIDLTFVMQPGIYTFTLDGPVNSEREGAFFAHLDHPIKSAAGVTLMEEGSRIWGTYKSEVGQYQERVTTVAGWGMTPYGVPVPFGDAAVGDGDGRNGMSGKVNTHLGSRLGSALMLMVGQGAIQFATAYLQSSLSRGGGGNTYLNLQTGGLDQALTSALRSGAAVQNTVDVPAGKTVAFLLTQPINFAPAYRLAPTGAR